MTPPGYWLDFRFFIMKKLMITIVLCAAGLLRGDVTPAALFQSGAVLQQGKPVPVWGTADAGEQVTVSFAGQTVTTEADASGNWSVTLGALPVSAEGAELTISGNNTVVLEDVVVGEVWLASGQSNMGWTVRSSKDFALERVAANYPLIREFNVRRKVSEEPLHTAGGDWRAASPETIGSFSAVAYFFARDLHQILGVPVGIINSSWGGTRVEAWMTPESAAEEHGDAFAEIHRRWGQTLEDYPEARAKHEAAVAEWEARREAAREAGERFTARRPRDPWGPGHPATPSGLYNGMIAPLVPYALSGFIWYQGESNAGRASEYRDLFGAMITGWREQFAQGDLPFYWVQLANYQSPTSTNWAFLREAQTQTLALPATGQAISIDIGDVTDIHPRNKQDVGRRLARLALNRVYDVEVVDSGPVFERAEREGDGFRVYFTEVHRGLRYPSGVVAGFELAGEDQVFHSAEATVENNTVLVVSESVPDPVAVRYAWRNAPEAGLFDAEDLPAVPFRSDDW